ncbi:MAG: PhzF family phenazine biosynthesis isomerase, partial [Baekduia sp.]
MTEILRLAAFTDTPTGGNPAGVVLDATALDGAAMQAIAADVGYSETAFFSPRDDGEFDVRYFSPRAEVSFCGHATIASSIALAERVGAGEQVLHTGVGVVRVRVVASPDGELTATLTSVAPRVEPLADVDLQRL